MKPEDRPETTRERDARALEAVQASRPLKPPKLNWSRE
jgi:hypothetical protein